MGFRFRANELFRGKLAVAILALVLGLVTGCQTPPPQPKDGGTQTNTQAPAEVTLRAGDTVRISFPGTPNLNSSGQQIRPDGKITLPILGEFSVAGMTPAQLEKELIERYASELVSKEVRVIVESASFVVYVNGMVLRPGPVKANRSLTVLEAIMEAGGYDRTKANLKKVRITRQEGGRLRQYTVDVEQQMSGGAEPFYLKPSDVVDVREKFTMF